MRRYERESRVNYERKRKQEVVISFIICIPTHIPL